MEVTEHSYYRVQSAVVVIGVSLSEPHMHRRVERSQSIYYYFLCMVRHRPSPAGRHRHYTSVCDIAIPIGRMKTFAPCYCHVHFLIFATMHRRE